MADEIPFRSLTIDEQIYFKKRFLSYHSYELFCDLCDIQMKMGVRLDGFNEFYACDTSLRQSLSRSIPFSKTLWMNFEKSFLTMTDGNSFA